ncbi:hypothetical protein ES703_92297 [subsurface metagenome]
MLDSTFDEGVVGVEVLPHKPFFLEESLNQRPSVLHAHHLLDHIPVRDCFPRCETVTGDFEDVAWLGPYGFSCGIGTFDERKLVRRNLVARKDLLHFLLRQYLMFWHERMLLNIKFS